MKDNVKKNKTNRGRDKYYKYKRIIHFFSKIFCIFPLKFRIKIFEHFRNTKGKKGIVIRYILLKTIAKKCGDNVAIFPGVYLLNPQYLSLGNNISIHPMCYIECLGTVEIGNDVSIAHSVSILSVNHMYNHMDLPIKDQDVEKKKVVIKDNVWIGCKATILFGRTINTGSIVGANCLVTKDVQSNQIVGGVPNRLIKERK